MDKLAKDRKDELEKISKQLEDGIKDVYKSERYKDYLTTMSKFHKYSYRNSLLIMMQNPAATCVAGYKAWQKNFNRNVKKGEKGIQILAPTPVHVEKEMDKLDPDTGKPILDSDGNKVKEVVDVIIPRFKPVYVFDIAQTEGEPLPQLANELKGNIREYDDFITALKSVSPFKVEFEDIRNGSKGYCSPIQHKIAIKEGMSQIQTVKTMIHEITHADLHVDNELRIPDGAERRTEEVEAESVAFIVCSHYGIDTSDYSFGYIAAWSSNKELEELGRSLASIQKQSSDLIDRIDAKLLELNRQRENEDMVKFDNDIDRDKEKNHKQLGYPDAIENRIAAAHETAIHRNELRSGKSKTHELKQQRGER